MISLIDVTYVKNVLKIDTSGEDTLLTALIAAASQLVVNYLDDRASEIGLNDSGILPDPTTVPDNVQLATAMLVGYLLNNPDSDDGKVFEMGYLPRAVTALLYTNRDPTLV